MGNILLVFSVNKNWATIKYNVDHVYFNSIQNSSWIYKIDQNSKEFEEMDAHTTTLKEWTWTGSRPVKQASKEIQILFLGELKNVSNSHEYVDLKGIG